MIYINKNKQFLLIIRKGLTNKLYFNRPCFNDNFDKLSFQDNILDYDFLISILHKY